MFLLFQNVPPDLSICTFVLEQSLSVRALQEMLANSEEKAEGVSLKKDAHLKKYIQGKRRLIYNWLLSDQCSLQLRLMKNRGADGKNSHTDLLIPLSGND